MKFVSQAEGYIEPDGAGGYEYVYQFTDHLGNKRLSYSDLNGDGTVDNSEIMDEKNYYPFGFTHQGYNNQLQGNYYPYSYNGKEENNEFDLNWLDFSARNYDPAIGRWMNVDPLAEKMRRHSVYNYAFDNPIRFIDPDGMMPCPTGDCPGEDSVKVAIDAGHGIDGDNNPQIDPGAVANGEQEKDLTLNISKSINSHLQSFGEETAMIREGDLVVEGNSLTFRTNKAKEEGSDIFVSIHINSAANEDASGFTVLFKGNGTNAERNEELAESIANNQTVMSVRGDGTTERNNLAVLNGFSSTGPAVLIEVGFITNNDDVSKMKNNAHEIGRDIAVGIYTFITGNTPNTPAVDSSLDKKNNKP